MNAPALARAALRTDNCARSFATLDRHAASGPIDTDRALRLLRQNARDAIRNTGAQGNARLEMLTAQLLLGAWRTQRSNRHGA